MCVYTSHIEAYTNIVQSQKGMKSWTSWATVDKNSPANAGDTGLSPGSGRFHMLWSNQTRVQLLDLCSRAHELQLLNPRATTTEACMPQSLCSAVGEATTMRSPWPSTREQTLLSTARESPCAMKTQWNQKSIIIIIIKRMKSCHL